MSIPAFGGDDEGNVEYRRDNSRNTWFYYSGQCSGKGITVYQGIVDKINISADGKKQLGMGMKGLEVATSDKPHCVNRTGRDRTGVTLMPVNGR